MTAAILLAIEASQRTGGVAVRDAHGVAHVEWLSPAARFDDDLLPAIDRLYGRLGLSPARTGAVAVSIGPGGFTGLRVGLSLAKGLVQGLRINIIGVSSLEALACQIPFTPYPLCPMIDSRRGEVFTALFRREKDDRLVRISEDASLKMSELVSLIDKTAIFLGNDFPVQGEMVKKLFGHGALLAPPHLWNLRASSIGTLGFRRFVEGDFDDLRELIPAYLRPPDIRPNPAPLVSVETESLQKEKMAQGVDKS